MNRGLSLGSLAVLLLVLIAAPAVAAPRFGFEGGFRYGELTREADPPFDFGPTPKFRPSWSVGTVVEQPLGGTFALVSGVRYAETREKFGVHMTFSDASSTTIYDFDFRTVFRSVELPVRIELRPFARGPLFEGGAGVAYLLNVTSRIESSWSMASPRLQYAQIFEAIDPDGNVTRSYNRWHGSIGLGTGWDIPTGGGIATIRLRYAHGITDVQKSDAIDRKIHAFDLTAGWRW